MQSGKCRGKVSIGAPPMPPVTFQFLIAMVASAMNERMARRLDYVQEEVRVLREALLNATGKNRIAFTAEQRQRLAVKGKALTPDERQGFCQLVRPATILKWFRDLAAKPYDGSAQRTPGRPRKPNELRELVLRLANENIGWGYTKIRDALRGMKIEIGRTTVADIMAESGLEPAPERTQKRTWKHFLKSHWETLYACDFFSVETLGTFGTVRVMVFFVIELKSRAVHIAGIRVAPDGAWMTQIARNLLDPVGGFFFAPRNPSHPRPRPVVHEAVDADAGVGRCAERADSRVRSKLQSPLRTVCQIGPFRMPRALRDLRRTAPPLSLARIRRALSHRALPSRASWKADSFAYGPE